MLTHPLTDDWSRTLRHPATVDTVARWGDHHPVLAGIDLDVIVERARAASVDLDTSDKTMAALFALAAGDPLARRAVLQVVLPRLVRTAQHIARDDLGDVVADLATGAWDLAGQSDGRWRSHLARRLTLLVRRRYHRSSRPQRPPALYRPVRAAEPDHQVAGYYGVGRFLASAVAAGTISPLAARVLGCVAMGMTTAEAAELLGVNYELAKKHRSRAAAALRAHPGTLALLVA